MTALVYVLAFIGAWTVLAIIGGFVFGVFFRDGEDLATVDLPDAEVVDLTDRLAPFTNNVRVIGGTTYRHYHDVERSGPAPSRLAAVLIDGQPYWTDEQVRHVRSTSHDPATCDACTGRDRSGF